MLFINRSKAGSGLLLLAAAAVALGSAGGPASASHYKKNANSKAAKITMFQKGRDLGFSGPKTVKAGTRLRIVNDTDPKKVGPHTFTLITKKNMPTTSKKEKACGQLTGVCGDIAVAHKFNPETGKVNKPNVEAGRKGWDKAFGRTGDSWYTEKKGEVTGRTVSAKPGRTLRFFCVVHPFMQGKIKVLGRSGIRNPGVTG